MTDPLSWEFISPTENLMFSCKTHEAAIRLAEVPEGWAWALRFTRWCGDFYGSSSGIGRRGGVIDPAHLAPTRAEAIAAASARLARELPDKPVLDWLASLNPEQADLFA